MLWTDTYGDRVYRASLNGTNTIAYIGTGIMSCAGGKTTFTEIFVVDISSSKE